MIKHSLLILSLLFPLIAQSVCEEVAHRDSDFVENLFRQRESGGHTRLITGGVGGCVVWVDNATDDIVNGLPVRGTLRWAFTQHLKAAKWIRFRDNISEITLNKTIELRSLYNGATTFKYDDSFITIDGGERGVRIKYDAEYVYPENVKTPVEMHFFLLRGVTEIIFNNLSFERTGMDANIYDGGFGDIISVAGMTSHLWVNRSSFKKCGDECLGLAFENYPNKRGRANSMFESGQKLIGAVTQSYFVDNNKCVVWGDKDSETVEPAVIGPKMWMTMFGNYFDRTGQRQPRLSGGANLIYYNNLLVHRPYKAPWHAAYPYVTGGTGISVNNGAKASVESNIFIATSLEVDSVVWKGDTAIEFGIANREDLPQIVHPCGEVAQSNNVFSNLNGVSGKNGCPAKTSVGFSSDVSDRYPLVMAPSSENLARCLIYSAQREEAKIALTCLSDQEKSLSKIAKCISLSSGVGSQGKIQTCVIP